MVAGCLLVGAPAQAQSFDQDPILFVHGFVGSAGQFESQKMRFMSNGYPERWIDGIDYDSTFATESRSQVHSRIDAMIADLKQRTGKSKVDLLGHSLGTAVSGVPQQLAGAGGQRRPLREHRRLPGRCAARRRAHARDLGRPGSQNRRIVGATN